MSGTNNFDKKYFLCTILDSSNFHHFCKLRACRCSVKNSIFQKLPKIVEKHFLWWVEQIILPKNIFLSTIQDSSNFHHFCKVRTCRYSVKNSIFQKLPKIVEKHFLWWVEQIILPKIFFLAHFKIAQIFTIFVRSAPYRYSFKNSIFQKLPKIVEKHFLWWVEQIILPKNIFLSTIQDSSNFHHFCKVRALSIFLQKLHKIVENHFLWVEQIILTKNIFLAQIGIIQIFTIFVRSAPVDILSKNQFSKNSLKLWRYTSFHEWNK